MTQPKPNIYQRLAAAMAEVTYIQKQRKQGMQYTIVSHDAVTAKVRPALLKHGVVYMPVDMAHSQNGNRTEVTLTVRFVNVDDPSDVFEVPSLGYGIDSQDKGPGKAMSYAVKYALLKAMGLETGDDADHDSVEHDPEPIRPASISMEQYTELRDMLDGLECGQALEDAILQWARVESLPYLPVRGYDAAKKKIMAQAAEEKREAA